jgi:hypothetical protein
MQEQFQQIYIVKKKLEDTNCHKVLSQRGTSLYHGSISLEERISFGSLTLIPTQLHEFEEQFSFLSEMDR